MWPILIDTGIFVLHTYGLCLVALMVIGFLTFRRQCRPLGITDRHCLDLACVTVGAILSWIVVQMLVARFIDIGRSSGFLNALPILSIGAFAFLFYLRKQRLPAENIFDCIAPLTALMLGLQYGIGTLAAGTAFGRPTDLPWGLSFPPGSLPHRYYGGDALHPTQLYMGFGLAMIAMGSRTLQRRYSFQPGQAALWTFVSIALFYLIISPLRANTLSIFVHGIPRPSEVAAISMIVFCIIMSIVIMRHSARK